MITKPRDDDDALRLSGESRNREVVLRSVHDAMVALERNGLGRSVVTRWVLFVLKAATASDDVETISRWCRHVGVGQTSLRESCYLVGVSPQDAKDFARVLRVVLSDPTECPVISLLNIADRRSLSRLWQRVGIRIDDQSPRPTVSEFLTHQRLIPSSNSGLRLIRELLKE
jgi:hypothetical protein